MKYSDARILVFCKAPVPGEVKTRLIPALGDQGACDLHIELATHILDVVQAAQLAPVQLWCAPDTNHAFFTERHEVSLYQQTGQDLGERMHRAFVSALADPGVNRVILIGADCPTIDDNYMDTALGKLEDHDAVIGPAEDGGYGLIGLTKPNADYFQDITWGTGTVCEDTCRRFNKADINWAQLPRIWDVDRPEDVARWRQMHD
mgnify:FL=1|jgi:rSAM/selenodomain-associated transferase 1